MHRVRGDCGGQLGTGQQAAGAFQAGGNDDLQAAGPGPQRQFDAGQQAALTRRFDDEAAYRRVTKEIGGEQLGGLVDGERKGRPGL